MAARWATTLATLLAGLLLVAGAAGVGASPARADGDPASDVLAAEPMFLAGDAGFSPAQAAELAQALGRLRGLGLPVRVAVIASPADLGSVTGLWQRPEAYARFLGEELSLLYRGTLLVVMPAGIGVARVTPSGVTGLEPRPTPPERGLAAATFAAVTGLAAAAGHRLALTGSGAAGASAGGGSPVGSIDPGSVVAVLIGVAVLAAAWLASLRARPLRS